MTKDVKAKVHLSFRRKIVLVALIVVILVSLEVYAHVYVQIHGLAVVDDQEATDSFHYGHITGTYVFSSSGGKWLVVWTATEASTSANDGFISIFKVEENNSLLTLGTDVAIVGLDVKSNHTGWFFADLDAVLYESNRTDMRIWYYFGEIGTYQIDFGLVVQVYEETFLATLPKGQVRIPLQTTISYGPQ